MQITNISDAKASLSHLIKQKKRNLKAKRKKENRTEGIQENRKTTPIYSLNSVLLPMTPRL